MGLPLERFDADSPEPTVETGPSADYLAGFAAGEAAAQARFDADQAALRAEIVAAFADLSFGYAEARRHVLDALTPLLGQIAMTVVPSLLHEGIAPELAQYLGDLARDESNLPLRVTVNTANAAQLERILPSITGIPITIAVDPSLGPGEARWSTPRSETALDSDSMVTGIRDAVMAVIDHNEPKERMNG